MNHPLNLPFSLIPRQVSYKPCIQTPQSPLKTCNILGQYEDIVYTCIVLLCFAYMQPCRCIYFYCVFAYLHGIILCVLTNLISSWPSLCIYEYIYLYQPHIIYMYWYHIWLGSKYAIALAIQCIYVILNLNSIMIACPIILAITIILRHFHYAKLNHCISIDHMLIYIHIIV